MKLRIRKTGEVVNAYSIDSQAYETIKIQYFTKNGVLNHFSFDSLEALNNVLEDYKPAEPLIKDKKVRKAVKAWAEVNSIEKAIYAERPNRSLCCFTGMGEDDSAIEFVGWVPTLEDDEVYSIAELCGEEEE